ncbi:single-stranded DNA-binding protein [Gryllotalpicola protaetiae]|uniref:Single-stranded DNA-binding protein n=1 Tax=Gryllotalpicola protaetiae TaxID=2419771 RepID=A0A387BMH9_9MICO|nr:single-stranded DNA-binding protein [Gryllotalpicola protaetiae]AYG03888.1 single-stranded DNA-binding protein [Gryllotalpicola protaetiae]
MSTRVHLAIEGSLAADPMPGESSSGTKFTRFIVQVSDRKRQDGEWIDGDTDVHHVIAFGRIGQNVCDSPAKGDMAIVTGDLKFRHVTDAKSGRLRDDTEIVADAVAPSLRHVPARAVRAPRPEVEPAAVRVTSWPVRVPGTNRTATSLS